eukprot:TRINITY_DN24939_c0_g1_i1.p1 TRINITY_DN24939_c0_g1~~TRINITY_DN24939_c0_g1_i1.p1  ORF type:complete len:273 (+),score=61.11 TRINITY_DN24939_c0_g1_i1:116-934(+)
MEFDQKQRASIQQIQHLPNGSSDPADVHSAKQQKTKENAPISNGHVTIKCGGEIMKAQTPPNAKSSNSTASNVTFPLRNESSDTHKNGTAPQVAANPPKHDQSQPDQGGSSQPSRPPSRAPSSSAAFAAAYQIEEEARVRQARELVYIKSDLAVMKSWLSELKTATNTPNTPNITELFRLCEESLKSHVASSIAIATAKEMEPLKVAMANLQSQASSLTTSVENLQKQITDQNLQVSVKVEEENKKLAGRKRRSEAEDLSEEEEGPKFVELF